MARKEFKEGTPERKLMSWFMGISQANWTPEDSDEYWQKFITDAEKFTGEFCNPSSFTNAEERLLGDLAKAIILDLSMYLEAKARLGLFKTQEESRDEAN